MRPLTDLPGPAAGGVFLHAMWRTGSSYLLSRFDPLPRWRTFYEPFNGEIGSAWLRARARADHERRRLALRHPAVDGGYFAVYEQPDPANGQPLWRLAHPRLPLHDVYRGLSPQGDELLRACVRVARDQGRQPVFGFCHSGVQIRAMMASHGGRHLYLERDPREQFFSYSPLKNDFFMAATLLQLLAVPLWRPRLIQHLPAWCSLLHPGFLRQVPHRVAMAAGRQLWRAVELPVAYQAFYLSWILSQTEAQRSGIWRTSLRQLERDAAERRHLCEAFGVDLTGLNCQPSPVAQLGLDFRALEQVVESKWLPLVEADAGAVMDGV